MSERWRRLVSEAIGRTLRAFGWDLQAGMGWGSLVLGLLARLAGPLRPLHFAFLFRNP